MPIYILLLVYYKNVIYNCLHFKQLTYSVIRNINKPIYMTRIYSSVINELSCYKMTEQKYILQNRKDYGKPTMPFC